MRVFHLKFGNWSITIEKGFPSKLMHNFTMCKRKRSKQTQPARCTTLLRLNPIQNVISSATIGAVHVRWMCLCVGAWRSLCVRSGKISNVEQTKRVWKENTRDFLARSGYVLLLCGSVLCMSFRRFVFSFFSLVVSCVFFILSFRFVQKKSFTCFWVYLRLFVVASYLYIDFLLTAISCLPVSFILPVIVSLQEFLYAIRFVYIFALAEHRLTTFRSHFV